MNSTLQIQQSVLQDVVSMLGDNEAMERLSAYLRRIKTERKAKAHTEMTTAEKEAVLSDIRDGLKELKLAKEGKIKLKNAREFLNEIRS